MSEPADPKIPGDRDYRGAFAVPETPPAGAGWKPRPSSTPSPWDAIALPPPESETRDVASDVEQQPSAAADEEQVMPSDTPTVIQCVETNEHFADVTALHDALKSTGVSVHKNALYAAIDKGKTIDGKTYVSVPTGDADDSTSDATDEVTDDVDQTDGGKDFDAEHIASLAQRIEDASDHRGRVRIFVVECDDCAPESITAAMGELFKCFQ